MNDDNISDDDLKEVQLTEKQDIQKNADVIKEDANIQAKEETTTTKSPHINVKVSFRTNVGWDGILILLFCASLSGVFILITAIVTRRFTYMDRAWAWIFILLAIFCLLIIIKFLYLWRNLAIRFTNEQQKERNRRVQRSHSAAVRAANNAKNIYSNLQVNGSWFLWKLYFSELIESAQQCNNLANIYLCLLPVEITSPLCFILAMDCACAAWDMKQHNTPSRRNKRLVLDIIVDFLCVFLPLAILYFRYDLGFSITEIIAITFVPTLFILAKLDDILEEVVHRRSANCVLKEQTRMSFNEKRRRESLFRQIAYLQMAKLQEDNVPRPVKVIASICKGLFASFFFIVAIVHLAAQPGGCDEVTWKKGCVNKIPFCKSLFTPTCNCASLWIEKDYSLTTLPSTLPDEMTGLRRMYIHKCNLTKLPLRMEKLVEMIYLKISYTKLSDFLIDVTKWVKLHTLHLDHNNITEHDVSLWRHSEVVNLLVNNNNNFKMPNKINLPRLMLLDVSGNNVSIPEIGIDNIPAINYLFLSGNDISKSQVKFEALKDTLLYLSIARCHLINLKHVQTLSELVYLDARNNSIVSVSHELKNMIKKKNFESHFAGNPVCITDADLNCKPLCTEYCWSHSGFGNGVCDTSCDSKKCDYDGGDCKL
eukprot:g12028.t1